MVEQSSGRGEAASSNLARSTMFFAHGVKNKKKELDVLRLSVTGAHRTTAGVEADTPACPFCRGCGMVCVVHKRLWGDPGKERQ